MKRKNTDQLLKELRMNGLVNDSEEVYLHQVFSGRRTPSRDRLLCLCIGLGASTEETQSLLQQAHHAPLYARDKRDAVLLFGLSHSLTLPEINDALFTAGAETLL